MRERGILPGRWDLADRLAADHLLVATAGRVDERRFGRHGYGLRHAADLHFRVNGRYEGPSQLDSLALDRGEPRQRKRHGVAAGPQALNRVLPRLVGEDRARLLDEHGARRFDRDAREYGARGISDSTDDRGLGMGYCRNDHDRNQDQNRLHEFVHGYLQSVDGSSGRSF